MDSRWLNSWSSFVTSEENSSNNFSSAISTKELFVDGECKTLLPNLEIIIDYR